MTVEEAIAKLSQLANELEEVLESSHELIHDPEDFRHNLGSAVNLIEIAIEQLEVSPE